MKQIMTKIKQFFNQNRSYFNRKNIIKILALLLIAVAAVFLTLRVSMEEITTFIQNNKGQTILISLAVYILFGFTFLPSIPLTLFIAVIIGPLQAALVATIGNTTAAFFEYQIGKSVGDVVHFENHKAKLPFGLNKLPVDSPFFMIAVRSVPVGTRVFSMACGAYEVPLQVYLPTTFGMYLLSSVFLAYGGAQLLSLL